LTYTPGPGFIGEDSFTYVLTDVHGATATATITVTVVAAATAALPEYSVPSNASVEVYVEKTGLVVEAMAAAPYVPEVVAADEYASLTPTEGLMVAFRSATETLQDQTLPAIILGVLIAWLLLLGLGKRVEDDEEDAGPAAGS
jgi:hypothetical protein